MKCNFQLPGILKKKTSSTPLQYNYEALLELFENDAKNETQNNTQGKGARFYAQKSVACKSPSADTDKLGFFNVPVAFLLEDLFDNVAIKSLFFRENIVIGFFVNCLVNKIFPRFLRS